MSEEPVRKPILIIPPLATKFFIDEDREKGTVNPRIFHKIIHESFGYILAAISVIASLYTSSTGVKASKLNIRWGQTFFDPHGDKHELSKLTEEYYLNIAQQVGIGILISIPILYSVSWFGRKVHSRMFFSLVHSSPTKFLQRTSNGIIVNRFSTDINALDNGVVGIFNSVINKIMTFLVLMWTITNGVSSWSALGIFVVFLVLRIRMRTRYMNAMREVKRLCLISQSPIIGTSIRSGLLWVDL